MNADDSGPSQQEEMQPGMDADLISANEARGEARTAGEQRAIERLMAERQSGMLNNGAENGADVTVGADTGADDDDSSDDADGADQAGSQADKEAEASAEVDQMNMARRDEEENANQIAQNEHAEEEIAAANSGSSDGEGGSDSPAFEGVPILASSNWHMEPWFDEIACDGQQSGNGSWNDPRISRYNESTLANIWVCKKF